MNSTLLNYKFYYIFSILTASFLGIGVPWTTQANLLTLRVEPIAGYEKIQQVLPTPHSTNRLIYGARVTAGVLLLSAESEYTHGVIEETFNDMTQKTTGDKLKVGLRSGFRLLPLLSFHVRGGIQADQEQTEQTSAGVTLTTKTSVYHPYGGAGARISLSPKISATADAVAVIPDIYDLSKNDYQITAGFAVQIP